MTPLELEDLVAISDVRFRSEQTKLKDILRQEDEIRSQLRELEEQHTKTLDLRRGQAHADQSYGGDVLWQGWVTRTRRDLQIRLAQILATKGQKMQKLRVAFGKTLASKEIANQHRTQLIEQRAIKAKDQEHSLQILSQAPKF